MEKMDQGMYILNFSIIINGRPRGKIKATQGLRQRDPSVVYFLIVGCLSRMLTKGTNTNLIKGFDVRNLGLSISHLQFADGYYSILLTKH